MHHSYLTAIFFSLLSVFSVSVVSAREDVRLAIVGPMGGTSASVGVQYKAGVSASLSNLKNGRLLGRSVVTNLYDDNCNSSIAEAVARQIIENPPAVVIGHSCSGSTIAGAPYYASNNILQITPASTSPKVTEMGINTIFRMIGRDDAQGKLAAKRIADLHADERLGILRFPKSYSRTLTQTAIAELAKQKISPVVVVEAQTGEASYADAIETFIQNKIDVLYMAGGGLDSGIFLRQARLMGANFSVISSDTLVSKVFQRTAGDAANGIPFTFPPEAVQLTSAAEAVDSIKAMGYEPVGYTLLAYAATQVWIEGVTRAQSFNAAKVAEAIRNSPVLTILGEVSFDEKGDIITPFAPFAWYTWQDGKRVALEQ